MQRLCEGDLLQELLADLRANLLADLLAYLLPKKASLRGSFWPLGASFWGSGRCPGDHFGPLEGHFGAPGGDRKRGKTTCKIKSDHKSFLGRKTLNFGRGFWDPKSTKHGEKT